MAQKIKKAVLPVAGLGTRFLPVTKAVPKELLPIVDKPVLLFIFQEILAAGIEEVVLIQGHGKGAIEAFFKPADELEQHLEKTGKLHLLQEVKEVRENLRIVSVMQTKALGLGHAVGIASQVVGREPFAVLLGDELMLPADGQPSAIGQLCHLYQETGLSTVSVMPVPDKDVSKYGIVEVEEKRENLWRVLSVVEKPEVAEAPSRLALPGRYVFDAKIFDFLAAAKPGKNGEIQLTDSMTALAKSAGLQATVPQGRRYDAGDRLGYLQANIEIGMQRTDIGPALKTYLRELVRSFS